MKLLRVQVPEFRALKDVDISFEPDFFPQVFPLGSLNGGGKSTLLQLIFVLLHCSAYKEGHYLIENILKDVSISEGETVRLVAKFELLNDKDKLELEFLIASSDYIIENNIFDRGLQPKENEKNCFPIVPTYCKDYLLCRSTNEIVNFSNYKYILEKISSHIFLISPSNQPYLFISKEFIKFLFSTEPDTSYDQVLKKIKTSLPNFFTYDFADNLTEVFRLARDKDYDERNEENPFAHTKKLEEDINNLFIDGKKIIPLTIQQKRHKKDAIQSMGFKLPDGTEIFPEDLSHGELKRLAIFVLIKYHEIQNSIVLMDEIENGFHPSWQRHIVDDLVEWGSANQYILATHSHELCRGVTFGHIKQLEPKLTPETAE